MRQPTRPLGGGSESRVHVLRLSEVTPTRPARFRVPTHCVFCGAVGVVHPETTIAGKFVELNWCCRFCERSWPITAAEQQMEERRSDRDRRRSTRADRRGRKPR